MSATPLLCCECEDMHAMMTCDECRDAFCSLCFQWQHQRGVRATHSYTQIDSAAAVTGGSVSEKASQQKGESPAKPPTAPQEGTTEYFLKLQREQQQQAGTSGGGASVVVPIAGLAKLDRGQPLAERAQFIPLRINDEERILLHLLQGSLEVSEYTDKVDVTNAFGYGWSARKPKSQIIEEELEDVFRNILGLAVCDNFSFANTNVVNKKLEDSVDFFQRVFEVGRRYKICNPQKMRTTYGKMMWMLQDMVSYNLPHNMPCKSSLRTIDSLLKEKNATRLLEDPRLVIAASEVISDEKTRDQIEAELEAKRRAAADLRLEYKSSSLSEADIDLVITSIADANSFLASNRLPVDKMIHFLTTYFSETPESSRHSLAIKFGVGTSKLAHDHATQYTFVHQSLVLWREIMHEMYYLWICTENDLLSERNRYQLYNTGQGLNRVQSAPSVGHAMHRILARVQAEVRGWVGLSVVHLGDRDVPNAFVFIDKYLQVPRILAPICKVIESLPDLYSQPQIRSMIDKNFNGLDNLRKDILADYFKHGFDGSGSDGGSCIDGRLTSSWNWCSLLEKKPFNHIFNLSGFQGFDGDFRK